MVLEKAIDTIKVMKNVTSLKPIPQRAKMAYLKVGCTDSFSQCAYNHHQHLNGKSYPR
jgi:hypothetical protein